MPANNKIISVPDFNQPRRKTVKFNENRSYRKYSTKISKLSSNLEVFYRFIIGFSEYFSDISDLQNPANNSTKNAPQKVATSNWGAFQNQTTRM